MENLIAQNPPTTLSMTLFTITLQESVSEKINFRQKAEVSEALL